MKMGSKTAAVVVTYNRRELLKKCIKRLLEQTIPCDIYVIDNASADGTADMIRDEYVGSSLRYFNTGKNLGCSGGNEFGIREALKAGYEYIWTLDDDVIPERDSLEQLFRGGKALKGRWGVLSSVVKWKDGSICKANRQKKSLFTFVTDRELKKKKAVRVKMVSFASMLIRASVVRDVGLPKVEYFIWTDDYEYSGRVSRRYPVYVIPQSVVLHEMKRNRKHDLATEQGERIHRYKYLFRNDVDCYRDYGIAGWSYILLKDIGTSVRILMFSGADAGHRLRVVWSSFKKGLHFRPEVRYPDRSSDRV
ncbi:MAG: glycosyltransferase [Lachnospiraceae bacterium]|nr:glycosyltransferase [Lachnospiraceae bacterium]